MVTYIFSNRNTEGERRAIQLGKDLDLRKVGYELIDADSAQGISLCELYDVMARPAVVLAGPNGSEIQKWDHIFPTASEIAYQYFL
jgi:hypothetical protein